MGAAYPLVQAKGQLNLAARKNSAITHMENNIIGTRITDARKKLNLSQAQLAERLFISPQAVGKWERGESYPDIVTVNRLAEILGVDLADRDAVVVRIGRGQVFSPVPLLETTVRTFDAIVTQTALEGKG